MSLFNIKFDTPCLKPYPEHLIPQLQEEIDKLHSFQVEMYFLDLANDNETICQIEVDALNTPYIQIDDFFVYLVQEGYLVVLSNENIVVGSAESIWHIADGIRKARLLKAA